MALKDPETAHLFHHYIKDLAPWYDLSDADANFAKRIPEEALSQPLLFSAVIAFAAIHLSRTRVSSAASTAEHFHSHCVRLLIALKEDDGLIGEGIALSAICLLRSYEILAEDFDPNRHLSGASALAAFSSLHAEKTSLMRAGFFNYLREDITFSLMNRCPLKIDLGIITIPSTATNDEDHLNIATLHLAGAINIVFGQNTSDRSTDVQQMHQRILDWMASLPTQFRPYFETPTLDSPTTFPMIRMLQDCHVATLQYCLVTISVLQYQQSNLQDTKKSLQVNAIRICGLAFTSDSPAVIVNSFGPISFSCRYLLHTSFRMELVRRLQSCRKETGWPVQRIIDDLERHWSSD